MPQPTLQQSHVNVPLTNLSIAYLQRDTAYACLQAAPVIPVDHKTNVYYIYKKDEWFRDDVQERAPSSESSGNGYNLDNTAQYNCHVYSHHHDIDDQIRSMPLRKLQDALRPLGLRLVVDAVLGAE